MSEPWLLWLFVGSLGLIWGSFFNVLILRLPAEEKIGLTRSRCPKCHALIPWYLNLPVVSYAWLRGCCRNCRQTISWRYPATELATAVLFLVLFQSYGPTLEWVRWTVLYSYLFVISLIDLDHRIIPNELSYSGALLGIVWSLGTGQPPWLSSLLGVFLGGGIFLAIAWLYERISGREGLGGGDVKLLGMLGAWLGVEAIPPIILYSSFLGSVVGVGVMVLQRRDMKTEIPFGPFLAVAAILEALWPGWLVSWFLLPV